MQKRQILLVALTTLALTPARAYTVPEDTMAIQKRKKGEERNVMLNASDANKPREIQIGLPSEDVNVYENGLPAVYSSSVHKLATHWRSDASLGEVGLMTPSESAILTGNIAYSVNSFSNFGQKEFKGVVNYRTNHFGWQNVDANVSGGIGDKWLYTASVYQNFDPGSYDVKFTDYTDRTQLYHAGVTRLFNNGRGKASLLYKYSQSEATGSMNNSAPFIYVGDGSVKEMPGFKLGTSSYAPAGGQFQYMDVTNGEMKTASFGDVLTNRAHELGFFMDYRFTDGTYWTLNAKYMNAPRANYVDFGGSTIREVTAADGFFTDDTATSPYEGLIEGRRTWLHFGKVSNALLTSELQRRLGRHQLRLGLNEWFYHLDYHSSSLQWYATATEYPTILTQALADGSTQKFYGFNELSPEYTKGYENKLALYLSDDWRVNDRLDIYLGGRLEYYRMSADQLPYERYEGFHIGGDIQPQRVVKDKLNYAATARVNYALTNCFSLTADATVATRYPRISEYAGTGPTEEQYNRVTIPLLRGGVSYRNSWMDLTSMVTYISKSNNIDQQNVTKPGTSQSKTVLLIYNIQTLGWTTSADIRPFKGFNLHALFTWQKPTYDNYYIKSPFEGVADLNANGNIVKEIPQVLIELDPSYQLTRNLRLWTSFRYFGKTYANLTNALYFNGRWETFGGVNWQVNDRLSLGATVVNFLNQKGASGTINGAELLTKDDLKSEENAGKFDNLYMSGNYLRPFTLEFSATVRF
jgi:hypothetical protein